MKESFFIGIYWNARTETLDDCATKTKATFDFLKTVEINFDRWFKTTKPRKGEIIEPLDTKNIFNIKTLLLKGRNQNEMGLQIEDLGYSIYLKSEKDYSKANILSITCGCSFSKVPNSVTLEIKKSEKTTTSIAVDILKRIYSALVEIWKPERGILRHNLEEILTETFDIN